MDKIRALIVCTCLLALPGCKPKGGVVGEWTGTQPNPMSGTTDVSAKFNADGTFVLTMGGGQFASETDGSYTYDDSSKQITLNMQKMKIGGQEVKITSGTMPPGQPTPVTWKGGDEFTMKFGVGDLDLKRK